MSNLLLHTLLPQEIQYFSRCKDHWVMYWVARWFSSFLYFTRLTIWVANKHFQMGNCEGFHLDKNKKKITEHKVNEQDTPEKVVCNLQMRCEGFSRLFQVPTTKGRQTWNRKWGSSLTGKPSDLGKIHLKEGWFVW